VILTTLQQCQYVIYADYSMEVFSSVGPVTHFGQRNCVYVIAVCLFVSFSVCHLSVTFVRCAQTVSPKLIHRQIGNH
jgi:hypothetical protein